MATKTYETDDIGQVHIYKRKGSQNIRLTVASDGKIRVTIPAWTPFASGLSFARSRADWIREHRPHPSDGLLPRARIGKAHRLVYRAANIANPSSRLLGSEICISYPRSLSPTSPIVQKVATAACLRALRAEAAALLPQRLRTLALLHDFTFQDVHVKKLKGRWGSCDHRQQIVLNLFLMQLPWPLIDYVLLHELVHTEHLDHGEAFWSAFLNCEPQAKLLRKQIKNYSPLLQPGS